jgi:hypothetical protein
MFEKVSGVTCIFSGDDVDGSEDFQRALGDVAEITDGRRDEVQQGAGRRELFTSRLRGR